MGERTRLFYPDFYLIELGIYIEVCGAERNEHYERTREIYEKNKVPIIYVETYKDEHKWKYHLIQSIKEIQEKRQPAVSTITPPQNDVKKVSTEPKQSPSEKVYEVYIKSDTISKQSQVGIVLTIMGFLLIVVVIFVSAPNITLKVITATIGLILFCFGWYITFYRFSRWFRNWYKTTKDDFRKWLQK